MCLRRGKVLGGAMEVRTRNGYTLLSRIFYLHFYLQLGHEIEASSYPPGGHKIQKSISITSCNNFTYAYSP